MNFKYLLLLLCFAINNIAIAQTKPDCDQSVFKDDLLDKMTGEWRMTGATGTKQVAFDFVASWTLNHQFMEWQITDILKSPPEYAGKVFIGYNCTNKQYVVHWIDYMGGKFSETLGYGTRKGDAIEIKFKYPGAPSVNTISYNKSKDSWDFHLVWQDKNKKWSTWSKTTLTRKR